MRNIYLIDKENTGNRFLNGLSTLNETDRVIVFHWEDSGDINQEVLNELAKTKAGVEIKKFHTHTKNAMDFQICTYLGILYSKYGINANYHIVSNDKGYMAAVEFIKEQIEPTISIDIIPSIRTDESDSTDSAINKLLGSTYNNKAVRSAVRKGLKVSNDLNGFHTYLQKNLNKDYHEVFVLIKPSFRELKMSY